MEVLYCFRLEDESGEFEPASSLIDALDADYSSFFERETMSVWHTLYSQSREDAENLRSRVLENLDMWREFDVDLKAGDIFELHKSEWADAWKKYFTPVEISETLLVTPAWQKPEIKAGQAVLKIDTGMSFGTGQHPTTFYCLKEIDRLAGKCTSMLDAGCGSGILAIAAALRGYENIDAFDFDPEAVKMSEENLKLNGVADKCVPTVADAAVYQGCPGKYDLVCANILGHLLISFRFNIASWVKDGGNLVLAGILSEDFDKVSQSFCEIGFRELNRETIKEWTGGIFVKE